MSFYRYCNVLKVFACVWKGIVPIVGGVFPTAQFVLCMKIASHKIWEILFHILRLQHEFVVVL